MKSSNLHIAESINWQFVKANINKNVRELALQKTSGSIENLPLQLQQIDGFQRASRKIPSWTKAEHIIYPAHISLEQCSSEATALYKASVIDRWSQLISITSTKEKTANRTNRQTALGQENSLQHYHFADLTGGLGVDFVFISRAIMSNNANDGFYHKHLFVEKQSCLCELAEHNFQQLNVENTDICCASAEDILSTNRSFDIVFLDPARRNAHGQRTYNISDCTPDILQLQDILLQKAKVTVLKLSPMLDHSDVINNLKHVKEIHFVGTRNECKELLVVVSKIVDTPIQFFCHADDDTINLKVSDFNIPITLAEDIDTGMLLVEPTSCMMKTRAYGFICSNYQLTAISHNSHLFLGKNSATTTLPKGLFRTFVIKNISSMNRSKLRSALKGIDRANVSVRNFPLNALELSHKLRLKDGGNTYIFATTNLLGQHIIIVCEKI